MFSQNENNFSCVDIFLITQNILEKLIRVQKIAQKH